MTATITAANVLAIGTVVEATWHDGTAIVGTITGRSWWFERLECYVVETAAPVHPVDIFQPARTEWRIYPPRDAIRAL